MSASSSPALNALRSARFSARLVHRHFVIAAPSAGLEPDNHSSSLRRAFHASPSLEGGIAAAWPNLPQSEEKKQRRNRMANLYQSAPSQEAGTRKAFIEGSMPEDIGLLPSTLVLERHTLRGSRTSSYLSLLWRLATKRAREFMSLMFMKFQYGKRIKLDLRSRKKTAEELHRKIYTAYAENDLVNVEKFAADGTRDAMFGHIHARSSGLAFKWTLHRYTASSKVMSDRTTQLPGRSDDGAPQSWIRQTVVRIKSRQSLARLYKSGRVGNIEVERDVTEFVVLQKQIINDKEKPWKFWGTVPETPRQDAESIIMTRQA